MQQSGDAATYCGSQLTAIVPSSESGEKKKKKRKEMEALCANKNVDRDENKVLDGDPGPKSSEARLRGYSKLPPTQL